MNCSCLELSKPNTCGTCLYGACPGCTYPNELDCRRHAPIAMAGKVREYGVDSHTLWPKVRRNGWCGDYQADIDNPQAMP